MTRTPPPPPPPPAGAPVALAPVPPAASPAARVGPGLPPGRSGSRGTPGTMRLLAAVLVALGLAVGLAAWQSFRVAEGALARASDNTAQIVRLQDIQTNLVRADAGATNAFLVGGLEPPEQRADYEAAVDRAADLLPRAASAQPADEAALAALTTSVVAYADDVALARANNRQALPVGAQYLRDASAGLRAESLPLLEALQGANQMRAEAEFETARRASVLVLVLGVLALGGVVVALVWLARRTHRYVNIPVAGAGLAVVAVVAVSAVVLGSVAGAVDRVRTGPYATALALSDARIAAFDAKANESLTLISRGSGASYEAAWVASAEVTAGRLGDATAIDASLARLEDQWAAYAAVHADVRALDDGGQWDAAVAAATNRDEGGLNAAFADFDTASAERLTAASEETTTALAASSSGLAFWGWLGVLAGLAVAALSWWGFAQRIEEYR